MNNYINFNGNSILSDQPVVTAENRGFRYGDGFFETMHVSGYSILLSAYHFERLFSAIRLLQFDPPASFTVAALTSQIADLCKKNNHNRDARVRLAIFRADGSIYDGENNLPNYIIQSSLLPEENQQLNRKGLTIGIFPDGRKAIDVFSNLKSNSYLVYAMAALYARKNQLNDCLLLNSENRICDSTIANVFCVKDRTIFTPALTQGCVAGVMRRYLLEKLPELGFQIIEKDIGPDFFQSADEVFLTNAICGIRWVASLGNRSYKNEIISLIHRACIENLRDRLNIQ